MSDYREGTEAQAVTWWEAKEAEIASLKRQLSEARADLNLLRDAGQALWEATNLDHAAQVDAAFEWTNAKRQLQSPEVPR